MFGGGSGHIFDMIARLKANEALRKKKSYYKVVQEYLNVTDGKKISFRQLSKEELASTRAKIKTNRKKETQKTIFSFLLTLLLLPLIVWLVIWLIQIVFLQ